VSVGGVTYTVTSSSHFLSNTGGPSCTPGAAAYFKIDSSVDWVSNRRGAVIIESIIAPPAGGTIRAQVHDQTDAPLQGVSVTANGPDYEVAPTDSNGCAVLSGLPAGDYSVSYALTGFVGPDGDSPLQAGKTTVTSTGNATPPTVKMGLAGSITANFSAYVSSVTPNPFTDGGEADMLSWYGTGASQSMSTYKSSPTSPGPVSTSLTSTALFPFAFTGPSYANNYQVWAGKCQQMQPPSGVDMFQVTPGLTQTVTVKEPELDVIVKNGASQIKPTQVRLSFQSVTPSATNCADAWNASIASDAATNPHGALANEGQPFMPTAANLSASTYYGTLSICAYDGSKRRTITAPGGNSNYSQPNQYTVDLSSGTQSGACP
jgi:hypothetical protein